jgi:hypothetical protein
MSMRSTNTRSRAAAVLALVVSDILLALAIWGAACVFQGVLGRWPLSAITIAAVAPNAVIWVWMRAALGLYSLGYGLARVEEIRRQTFALFATVGIILVFTFSSQLGGLIPRTVLFGWALGLLVVAPVVRHYVKASLLPTNDER